MAERVDRPDICRNMNQPCEIFDGRNASRDTLDGFIASSVSVKVAGQEISEVSQASLRRAVGVVPQDTILFNDTIWYNVAYGDLSAPPEKVAEVARKAQLDASIASMPQVCGLLDLRPTGHSLARGLRSTF